MIFRCSSISFVLASLAGSSLLVNAADHRSGYHWARSSDSSFTLGIVRSVENDATNDWLSEWDLVLDEWNKSDALDLTTIEGDNDEASRKSCSYIDGYVHVCNADYGTTTWSGQAVWTYTTWNAPSGHEGHMMSCKVLLNDNASVYSEEQKVLCHEIGHCLGLGHTSEDGSSQGSCMDYASGVAESRTPSAEDYTVLEDVYGHADTWDSYEIVESGSDPTAAPVEPTSSPTSTPTASPTKGPTSSPTRAPVVSPTLAPVTSPTLAPVASVTGPPTSSPTAAPTAQATSSPTASPVVSLTAPPTVYDKCTEKDKKKDCDKAKDCSWENSSKTCSASVTVEPSLPGQGNESCDAITDKDTCKDQDSCKWKKNECVDGRRHLSQCSDLYKPEDFDVPSEAVVVDCGEYTVTFEMVNGFIATRFEVVLGPGARRLRRLRGSA
eukprot:Nitzschia sp. Nitz4//scaffold77_size91520//67731//69185//NITZ4_004901-RA/size91520-augustus-gene-0.76-mRNA-1//-1//CDS//3329558024//368//frame0